MSGRCNDDIARWLSERLRRSQSQELVCVALLALALSFAEELSELAKRSSLDHVVRQAFVSQLTVWLSLYRY